MHSVHPAAEDETSEAATYYEAISSHLADAFADEDERAVARVLSSPRMHPPTEDGPAGYELREVLLRRFPYRLVVWLHENSTRILAVAHLSRKPGYWKHRITSP